MPHVDIFFSPALCAAVLLPQSRAVLNFFPKFVPAFPSPSLPRPCSIELCGERLLGMSCISPGENLAIGEPRLSDRVLRGETEKTLTPPKNDSIPDFPARLLSKLMEHCASRALPRHVRYGYASHRSLKLSLSAHTSPA